jgi:hypothetical protein
MYRNGRPYGLPILWPERRLCTEAALKKKIHLFARGGSSPGVAVKKERRQPMRAACRLAGASVSGGRCISNGGARVGQFRFGELWIRVRFLTHNETGSKGFWATVTGSLSELTQKPNPLAHLDSKKKKKKRKENDFGLYGF